MFLADTAQDIHLIYLENDTITVNGPNLLAFDAGIDWDIHRLKGGAAGAMAGGLFNMELSGTGWVAILSDGPPVLLNVAQAPTFADAQAAITWSSGVTVGLKTDFKMKNLIGRGSGESIQLAFSGQGWALIQPSEGRVVPTTGGSSGGGGLGNLLESGGEPGGSLTRGRPRPRRRGRPRSARTRGTTSAPRAPSRTRRAAAARRRRRCARPSRRAAAARRRARGLSR